MILTYLLLSSKFAKIIQSYTKKAKNKQSNYDITFVNSWLLYEMAADTTKQDVRIIKQKFASFSLVFWGEGRLKLPEILTALQSQLVRS